MDEYKDYIDSNVFNDLNSVDVSGKTERKNGFTYLSWAFAWGELKKRYPDATYKVYENADGWMYHTDGKTAWVKVGVTIKGLEHIEILPVMSYQNKSIPLDAITSCDANKAVQRALTKAIARHGLGLFVYAGEDLPEDASAMVSAPVSTAPKSAPKTAPKSAPAKKEAPAPVENLICSDCGNPIEAHQGVPASDIAKATKKKYGVQICMNCSAKRRAKAEEIEKNKQQVLAEPIEDEGELPFDIT